MSFRLPSVNYLVCRKVDNLKMKLRLQTSSLEKSMFQWHEISYRKLINFGCTQ